MEVKFSGRYDRTLFYKAVRIANQPPKNQQRFLWFMLIFAAGSLVLILYRIFDTRDFAGNALLLFAAVVMLVGVGVVTLQPTLIARKMWANPGTRRELRGQVTSRGIVYELDVGRNEIRWERFGRVRKTEDLVTLVRRDGLLVVFPRRFFKRGSDWRKFLKLVDQNFRS